MESAVFVTLLALIATLMHGYVSRHIIALAWFDTAPRRRNGGWLSLALWLIFVAGLLFSHGADPGPMAILEQLALDWFGALFIASTVLLSFDLLTGFGLWFKHRRNQLRNAALAGTLVMIVIAVTQGCRPPQVVHYGVTLNTLPRELDGTTLVILSDLHLDSQLGVDWFSARAAQVAQLNPDIIILLGDLFEGHGKPDPALQPIFSQLSAPLGVYAVTGNHETYGDHHDAIAMTQAAGVQWLRNRRLTIAPGLSLVGVDDLSQHHFNGDEANDITPLLQQHSPGTTLLLSHSPLQVENAAANGVDLMLSGHTHNGQIWPFNYLVQRFYPYITGRYQVGAMTLIVSRGTGLWGPRMRLWQAAEITTITLKSNLSLI